VVLLPLLPVLAVPAHPGTITVQQPDSTTLAIRLVGDEWQHFTTTEDGYTIMKDADGYYVYAEQQGDDLIPSTRRAHDAALRDADENTWLAAIGKQLAPKMSKQKQEMRRKGMQLRQRVRTAAKVKKPLFNYNDFRGLIILVEYNDRKFSRSDYPAIVKEMWNKTGYTGYDGNDRGQFTGSVRDYFYDNSNGRLNAHFDVVGPVTIDYSQYDVRGSDAAPLIGAALDAADPMVDFSRYDGNGDGEVDVVYFIFAGLPSNDPQNDERLLWPHAWYMFDPNSYSTDAWIRKDGMDLVSYACSTELSGSESDNYLSGIGTICHELGHVLGLPDLYDKSGNGIDPGSWTIMASGNSRNYGRTPVGYGLYERYSLGLSSPEKLNKEGTYSFRSLVNSNKGYRIDTEVENEFFLLENRQQTDKWDTALPGHGLLVFRVDSTDADVWEYNWVNMDPAHHYYDMIKAHGGRGVGASDAFPGPFGVTSLTNTTEPANLLSWSGIPTRMVLEDIAEDSNGTVSFRVVDTQKTPVNPDIPAPGSYTVKYWFDNQQTLAGTLDDVYGALQLDVSGLSDGLHALHIMVCGTLWEEISNPLYENGSEYIEETPMTVYFEKRGDETQVRNLYFIDDVQQSQQNTYATGKTYDLAIPVQNVSEGFHRLTTMVETTQGLRPLITNDYFQRVMTAAELNGLRLSVSIDDVAPTVLQRAFTGDSLVYDLDVSQMQPGLHTLAYQVKGVMQTAPEKAFFLIDPKVSGLDYWLNDDRTTLMHTNVTPAAGEMNVNLPVPTMPLRSDKFFFAVEEGIAVTYAINDLSLWAINNIGYWDESAAHYIDTRSRQPVNSVLLPQNKRVTATSPAAGVLKWYYLKANRGDVIGLQSTRPCTLQLFSPSGNETYHASGSKACAIGESMAPESGTFYLALHDLTDNLGESDVTVSYFHSASPLPPGDVNGDGSVDVADIATIISVMAGTTGPQSGAPNPADVNGDGIVDVADIATVISIMAANARASQSVVSGIPAD